MGHPPTQDDTASLPRHYLKTRICQPRQTRGTHKPQAAPRTHSATNFSIYRNFKVVSANKANTSETIQKRTMIFDSDQPINSK